MTNRKKSLKAIAVGATVLGLVAAAIILFVFWKPEPAGKAKTGKR